MCPVSLQDDGMEQCSNIKRRVPVGVDADVPHLSCWQEHLEAASTLLQSYSSFREHVASGQIALPMGKTYWIACN